MREPAARKGFEAYAAEVPDAEEAKTAQVAAFLWGVLGPGRVHPLRRHRRRSAVAPTTDLAGFVAATWLRGVRVVHVPTTLLGMVDAAVGGKTGINTTEGKNLVGAFHPPAGVLCDLATLETLPRARLHRRAGRGRQVRVHRRPGDPRPRRGRPRGRARPGRHPRPRAHRARRSGSRPTSSPRTSRSPSLREVLNYGHTFGHAVEQVERYAFRHGAAVSIGMVYVAELARLAGKIDDALVDRHRVGADRARAAGRPTAATGGRSCSTP